MKEIREVFRNEYLFFFGLIGVPKFALIKPPLLKVYIKDYRKDLYKALYRRSLSHIPSKRRSI